jgi:hypothetical protein
MESFSLYSIGLSVCTALHRSLDMMQSLCRSWRSQEQGFNSVSENMVWNYWVNWIAKQGTWLVLPDWAWKRQRRTACKWRLPM